MKKYRLKEEVKKYFQEFEQPSEEPLTYWLDLGLSEEALEEVPSRIELVKNYRPHTNWSVLYKKDHSDITPQEKDLCEKALNGELFTKDDIEEFHCDYYQEGYNSEKFNYWFEQYLKERK